MEKEKQKKVDSHIKAWIDTERLNDLEEDMLKAICNGTFREHVINEVKSRHPLEVFSTFNRLVDKGVIVSRKEADLILIADIHDENSFMCVNINEE